MTQQQTEMTAAARNDFADGEATVGAAAPTTESLWHRLLFWGGLIVGAAMLLLFPLAKPLWTDEVLNMISGTGVFADVATGRTSPRDHTPLQAVVIWVIQSVFGHNVAWYRFFSALPAVVTPYITYLLGRRISPKVGLLALWITALAPGILLFDRMARYHGMLGLLATLSVYLFLRALGTGKKQFLVGYTLVTLCMLYVYVPSLFLVIGQFCSLAYHWRRERHALSLFGAMVVCAVCLSPMILWQLAAQGGGGGGVAGAVSVEDPSVGQGIGGFIRRVGLPVYMYCLGETIYPWSWFASVPGIVGTLFAFMMGTRYLIRGRDFVVPVTVIVTTLLFGAITSGKFGALQTLGSMGKRNSFLIPLFCVTVATGLMTVRPRPLRIGLIAVLFAVWGYADFNYWSGREFLNANYTAPWQAVFQRLESERVRENALIITDEDVVNYTVGHGHEDGVPVVMPNTPGIGGYGRVDKTLALTAKKKGERRYIYYIGRDRGNRLAFDLGDKVCDALAERYTCLYEAGFMKRTESEKYWLEKMLKRPTPSYYIWVKRYDTWTPPGSVTAINPPGEEVHP